jgi:biofilm PGA synthesis N-glycosyltransferase PgaC
LKISACIPCFNDWDTISESIESIHRQTEPVHEIVIIDDASKHQCPHDWIRNLNEVTIHRNRTNQGRGFSRQVAIELTNGDYILTLDATNTLQDTFIEKALPHFNNPKVAAVSGTYATMNQNGTNARWRSRHLFHENSPDAKAEPCEMLITYGTLLRRNAIEKVGGFDKDLRFKEDQELGERLGAAGYSVIGDPSIKIFPTLDNSVTQLLERYARWHMDPYEKPNLQGYLHNIKASIKPMIESDLRAGDWSAALISSLVPHFQLYHGVKAYLKRKNANRKHH